MLVNDFTKVAMCALFGDLVGLDGNKGISHLALGAGLESWDAAGLPSVTAQTSGVTNEVIRIQPSSVLFTKTANYTTSGVLSSSGFYLETNIGDFPYHFNGLNVVVTSGATEYNRYVSTYDPSGTTIMVLDSGISGMTSGSAISLSIEDVTEFAGTPTDELRFNFHIPENHSDYSFYREKALMGALASQIPKSGKTASLTRNKSTPVSGPKVTTNFTMKLTIGSGLYVI